MKTLIVMSLLLTSNLWAQVATLPDGIMASGNIRIDCQSFFHDVSTKLEMLHFGEDKVRVSLLGSPVKTRDASNDDRWSRDFALQFIGVENGLGSYDLYPSTAKSFDKRVGELIQHKTSVMLSFDQAFYVTSGRDDRFDKSCNFGKNVAARFNTAKPQCFNKRGKEISCPEIRY
jgi:hypothetical protein